MEEMVEDWQYEINGSPFKETEVCQFVTTVPAWWSGVQQVLEM